ncbi:TPA: DUF58 domain-containing protein [Candidatus Woesearchaeota archaeon]|nr:DUF58 domain-containing protein [Candidatus Woesearchaeota archaeon]HII69577.1 DUF58 domain-containing protein [Candidatus Woesearchaeota archaeon]
MAKLHVNLTPALKKLSIVTKGVSTSMMMGQYKSMFRGRGVEFDSYRKYAQGDDASMIDWRASARAGPSQVLVKQFVEERNITVFFLIDVSSSMVFGSTSKLKNEYAAELVASLTHVALESGDSVGFAAFSDNIVAKTPPAANKRQFYLLSKTIVDPAIYGGNYDLAAALVFTLGFVREYAIVMIVSDFIGLKGEWKKALKLASGKFDLVGIMVRDPRDRALPAEETPFAIRDPFSGKTMKITPAQLRRQYEAVTRAQEDEVRQAFHEANADLIMLSTDKPFATAIRQFFEGRQRVVSSTSAGY